MSSGSHPGCEGRTGGKGVAGIQTDTNTAFVVHLFNNFGDFSKLPPQVAAPAGGIFYYRDHALSLLKRHINGLGNFAQAVGDPDFSQVTAG